VAQNTSSFNNQTGEFALEGNTPRPDGRDAPPATPAAPPPAGRAPARRQ
jgi:hypothetical protein